MSEIPLRAKVQCTDGLGGESTTLIVDRAKLTVSYVVVREDKGDAERLVPVDRVVETTADSIRLNCTLDNAFAEAVRSTEVEVGRTLFAS